MFKARTGIRKYHERKYRELFLYTMFTFSFSTAVRGFSEEYSRVLGPTAVFTFSMSWNIYKNTHTFISDSNYMTGNEDFNRIDFMNPIFMVDYNFWIHRILHSHILASFLSSRLFFNILTKILAKKIHYILM